MRPTMDCSSDEAAQGSTQLKDANEERKHVEIFKAPIVEVQENKSSVECQPLSEELDEDEDIIVVSRPSLPSSHTSSHEKDVKDRRSTEGILASQKSSHPIKQRKQVKIVQPPTVQVQEEKLSTEHQPLSGELGQDEDEDVILVSRPPLLSSQTSSHEKDDIGERSTEEMLDSQKESHTIKRARLEDDSISASSSDDITVLNISDKCPSTVFNDGKLNVDDSYVYCDECEMQFLDECSLHPLIEMDDLKVTVGVADRARLTLPPGLSLSNSRIRGAGKGVWTVKKMPKCTRFGPYEGVTRLCNVKTDMMTAYEWLVRGEQTHYIDGEDITTANWLRYVKCARVKKEQNLEAFQYKGKIYYKALTDIPAGRELLVWYGDHVDVSKADCSTSMISTTSESKDRTLQRNADAAMPLNTCDSNIQGSGQSQLDKQPKKRTSEHKIISCMQCDYSCGRSADLQKHMRTHAGEKPFKCTLCDYRSARSSDMKKHRKTHSRDKPFACTQCDYRAVQSIHLQRHMVTHTGERPFACTQCDYKSSRASTLQTHIRTHTGEKPYECDRCDFRCAVSSGLRKHMRTHTGEKPYACTQCDSKFARSLSLQTHMRIHTGEKPFACAQCDYKCARSSALQTHVITHSGEKPFACTHCDYKCARLSDLQTHIRTHTDENQFACTHCDYKCAQLPDLQTHIRTHTNENQFACAQCDYRSAQSSALQAHMKTHAGE